LVLQRFLLVEAAQVTVRRLLEWRSKYVHLTMRRGRKIAKVATARKLAVRLYWISARNGITKTGQRECHPSKDFTAIVSH
jgi:hypothetical protein